ncbi:MAG: hypothetical protein EU531_05960 [Promethearchaeota archaeon]|nr:MAG: hypothetical protein EU531_05960 [Candidatus Lokiarchaeota archaeon]
MAFEIEILIIEIIMIVLFVLALRLTFKSWRDTKNRMYIAVSVYVGAVITNSILTLLSSMVGIDKEAYIVGYLKIGIIIAHILFVVQFEFILYLRRLTKLYTLPFIATFYLILGQLINPSIIPFIIYATVLTYPPAYFILRDGKKNRNGLAIGMGLFFLFWGLGYVIQISFIYNLLRILSAIAFYLGAIGFYEKYLFPDQEDEEKIVGTWISKLVIKE